MKSFLLLLTIASLLFVSCQSTGPDAGAAGASFGTDAPDWVRSGQVPKYPPRHFLTGLGYSANGLPESDAYSQARLQAFKEITDQIETHISNEFTSIQRSVFHNENVDELVDLKSVSRQVTEELLAGAEVVDRYYEGGSGTAAVFAVMDRIKLSERLLKEAKDARTQADGFMQGYAGAGGDPSAMLKSLVHAQAAKDRIVSHHLKALAVGMTREMAAQFEKLNDAGLSTEIAQKMGQLKDKIRIEAESGDGQRATLDGLLKEPVKVRVMWENVPVAAFPMTVAVPDEAKAKVVPGGDATDEQGRFSFRLQELKATGKSANTVAAVLDFAAIEKKNKVSPPSLAITYLYPTPDTTRVGVMIHETIDGEEHKKPYTGSAIKDALTEIGFQVIMLESDVPAGRVVEMPPSELRERFAKQCDYLIVGTAEAEKQSEDEGIQWYMTRLVLDAVELDTGKTIHFEVPFEKTKVGQGTDSKAIRASLNKAADMLVGDPKQESRGLLTEKFIARFEEGADWAED